MLSPSRRIAASCSSGMIQIKTAGDTSPVLLINPVFTITENNFNTNSTRRYPKVRQKSKSSGASPQKYPNPQQFHDEFINIITSTDSMDYLGGGHSSRSSNASARSFLHSAYGSNSKLLQVPSSSVLLLPCGNGYYDDDPDDLSPTRNSRQQRSSSITVPIQHQRSPDRYSSEVYIRRCSSASPKRRGYDQNNKALQGQHHHNHLHHQPRPLSQPKGNTTNGNGIIYGDNNSNFKNPKGRDRGFSLTTSFIQGPDWNKENHRKVKRRRSSGYHRRASNQSIITAFSSSSSSISSPSSNTPKHKLSPCRRQRTHSMPSCAEPEEKVEANRKLSQKIDDQPSPEQPEKVKLSSVKSKSLNKGTYYDVVIIGSPNVGKSTLAEYFNKVGTSGSDQGIGSEEDELDDCCDEDLTSGKAIIFKPVVDFKDQMQYNFSLRVFTQQTSAVNHLYKYDAVVILYSVTDRDSFEFARNALGHILSLKPGENKFRSSKVTILVGNKSDLERSRCVSILEGRSLATAYDCKFIEISSSLDVGIDCLQKGLATQVYLRHQKCADPTPATPVGLTSSNTINSSNNSRQRSKKKASFAALSSLRMAQKLIDRIMSIKGSNAKSRSCLDLHSL